MERHGTGFRRPRWIRRVSNSKDSWDRCHRSLHIVLANDLDVSDHDWQPTVHYGRHAVYAILLHVLFDILTGWPVHRKRHLVALTLVVRADDRSTIVFLHPLLSCITTEYAYLIV